jgi:hypothetical protein
VTASFFVRISKVTLEEYRSLQVQGKKQCSVGWGILAPNSFAVYLIFSFYNNFLYRVLAAGIHVPVIPGIMPVINSKQIKRSCELSGTALPPRFKAIADKFSDVPEAMQQAGIAYATEQIIDLVANGVKYFHIYTMNRPETAAKIMENLSCILR